MTDTVPDPTSSEKRNIMKSMRSYLDAHSNGGMNYKMDDIEQFVAKKMYCPPILTRHLLRKKRMKKAAKTQCARRQGRHEAVWKVDEEKDLCCNPAKYNLVGDGLIINMHPHRE
ncbi:hypothetical protein TNCV_2103911 [Trichonephila clavipes]|nr:hypothetical protein TNCV_2103911 [Trichonephila clavipes]